MYTTHKKNNKKKKIFLVLPNLTVGGAERVYINLANKINKKKFEIFFIVFFINANFLKKQIKKNNIKFINLDKRRIIFGIWKVLNLIKKNKPDIVMSTIIHLNCLFCFFKFFFPKKTKLIIRNSNLYSEAIKVTKNSFLISLMFKLFYKKADHFIFISKGQFKDFSNHFKISIKNSTIINNPIDFKKIKSLSKKKIIIKKKYKNYILACGSFKFQKGFDILLEAFKKANLKRFKLLILGSGTNKQLKSLLEIKNRFKLNSSVFFLGSKENVFPYFKKSKAIIIPSRFEGCCNVLIEALVLKKPVILNKAPGIAIELLKNGKGYFISKRINSNSLSSQITKFSKSKVSYSKSPSINLASIKNSINAYQNCLAKI